MYFNENLKVLLNYLYVLKLFLKLRLGHFFFFDFFIKLLLYCCSFQSDYQPKNKLCGFSQICSFICRASLKTVRIRLLAELFYHVNVESVYFFS